MALPPLVPNPAEHDWRSTWVVVAAWLIEQLEARGVERFESGFRAVSAGLRNCDSMGRQAAATALFGDFTRRAIAAGVERTRFLEWLGPPELLEAPSGRVAAACCTSTTRRDMADSLVLIEPCTSSTFLRFVASAFARKKQANWSSSPRCTEQSTIARDGWLATWSDCPLANMSLQRATGRTLDRTACQG